MISIKEFLEKSGCETKLAELMGEVIPVAVKQIRAAIAEDERSLAGSQNASGDKQLALDIIANEIVMEELSESGLVSFMASEELEDIVHTKNSDQTSNAPFAVAFDPLDGSSLVDVNFAVGSIFGVYPTPSDHPAKRGAGGEDTFIGRTGEDQVAACFAVYGPHTTIVLTVKKGTHEFRLAEDGKFYLMKENCQIAPDAKYFAPGNLRAAAEREEYLALTNEWIKNSLTLRYSGGMVPDINHILIKGSGVFAYPGYSKTPNGKLRLLVECNPMALIIEQAGGAASDGKNRILTKKITTLHETSPIFLGSKNTVAACVKNLKA